jgi:hypothetical protein
MDPTQQQMNQAIIQPQPLATFNCWSNEKGGVTLLSAKKIIVYLYPGWLIAVDAASNQVYNRIQLTPDLVLKNIVGTACITHVNGQDVSGLDKKMMFTFYNPWFSLLSNIVGFLYSGKVQAFITSCKSAAGTDHSGLS